MPKKKLPTGPIRIDPPIPKPVEEEGSNPNQQETRKQDSSFLETDKVESTLQEDSKAELTVKESGLQYNPNSETEQDSTTPETRKQDSGKQEYKKVAMRLSLEAVESLRQFRTETGIPYEILVDVMVRNWDDLPQRIQVAYLKQAKQARGERLLAGQEKAMKTMREKLS